MEDERNLGSSGHMTTNMSTKYVVPVEMDEYDDYKDYDLSQSHYFGDTSNKPAWEFAVKIALCITIIVTALIGNILVIFVVAKNKRMRTTTNFYIVNLAVADVMITLCCTWVQCVDDLTPKWELGHFFCKFNTFTQVLSMVSSVLTLTVIACDRFFGIVFAMKAHMTERRASVFITLVWVIAVAVSCPLLFYRKLFIREWKDYTEIYCQDQFPVVMIKNAFGVAEATMPSRVAYYTSISIVLFFLPVVVMSIAYCMIIWRLRSSHIPGERVDTEASVQDKLKKKVVIMLVMILSVFVICWLPYQIILFIVEHRPKSEKIPKWFLQLQFFAIYIGYANSAINPIIYAGFNENFKKGFKDALKCLICFKDKRRYSAIELRQDSYHSQSLMSQTQVTSVVTKV